MIHHHYKSPRLGECKKIPSRKFTYPAKREVGNIIDSNMLSLNEGDMLIPLEGISKWSFLVGKTMVVGETHHFRIHPPYIEIWLLFTFGVSKNRGRTPKWMVKIMETPILMDDLGVPLCLETPISKSDTTFTWYSFCQFPRPPFLKKKTVLSGHILGGIDHCFVNLPGCRLGWTWRTHVGNIYLPGPAKGCQMVLRGVN